ncbi:MAG: N-methyl-L-tryptophan oxidase [Pseudomonadota bacterium]
MAQRVADALVVGLGVMGAAVTAALTRRGLDVVGFDQYTPPHHHGSSHGQTRLLRTAYVEGEIYVPLIKRAIDGWRELEAETGEDLFHQSGIVYLGGPTSTLLRDLNAARARHDLPFETLDTNLLSGEPLQDGWQAYLECAAGFVRCEPAVRALHQVAQRARASLLFNQPLSVSDTATGNFHIRTQTESFEAPLLFVCVGPWFGAFMETSFPHLVPIPTILERRSLHWYRAGQNHTLAAGFRPFCIDLGTDGWLYGFPALDGKVKVSNHHLGMTVDTPHANADTLLAQHRKKMAPWVTRHLPSLGPEETASTCLYTTSPDTDFILGPHPENRGLILATGFSGHGFKFAPVIGEMLADCINGQTAQIVPRGLRPKRFTLR